MKPLKIIDFTARLPGPLASKLLLELGHDVTRIEFKHRQDPFKQNLGDHHLAFNVWAQNFEQGKRTLQIEENERKLLDDLIEESDIILCSHEHLFDGVKLIESFKKYPEKHFVEICGGSSKQRYLHDLNALFLTRSFLFHLKNMPDATPSLPYLPFAGIIFAQQIALEILNLALGKRKYDRPYQIYLDKSVKRCLDLFWDDKLQNHSKFLHNGLFPCYNIYESKDGSYIALAAVESKFWSQFTETFRLNFSPEERFDTSGRISKEIAKMFAQKSIKELRNIIGDKDFCINLYA